MRLATNKCGKDRNRRKGEHILIKEILMAVSGIFANTAINQTSNSQTKFGQVKNDFQQLGQALQSGDLNAAKQAFAALQQFMPNLSSASQSQNGQQGSSQNPLLTDLSAVGKALQSGDLAAAKSAFAKLRQNVQSVSHKGHHHGHHKTGGAQNSLASLLDSSSQTNGTSSASQSIGGNINITA
jgi:DNA-binding FadR family transcriptional regulator